MSTETPQPAETADDTVADDMPPGEVLTADSDFTTDTRVQTMSTALNDYGNKLRSGDLGALPAIFGLVVLIILFYGLRPETFLSKFNIANLLVQTLPVTILAMGLVFVLLLGEIDLSAGVASGACAAVMAKLLIDGGQNWVVAVLAAAATGVAHRPGDRRARRHRPHSIVRRHARVVPRTAGHRAEADRRRRHGPGPRQGHLRAGQQVHAGLAGLDPRGRLRRPVRRHPAAPLAAAERQGTVPAPFVLVLVQVVLVAVALLGGAWILNLNRARTPLAPFFGGVPWGVPLVAVLLIICTFVLGRTAYGRHVYAVGGNAEAARRAGHQRHPASACPSS